MSRIGVGCVVVAAAFAGAAQSGQGQPDVQEIIRRSVAATEENWKLAPDYAFMERDIESKKDHGKTTKTYVVLMIDGSPYNKLTAVNGQPLSKGEAAAEEQKLQEAIQTRRRESSRERAKRIAKYQRERTSDEAMMKEMTEAFQFRPAGEETLNGHSCWVFDATPKPGYQPKTRETKVLLGMKGRLWIDKSEYQWVRVKAEVTRPVRMYGLLARVGPGTRFELDQEPVAANLWLPRHYSVNVAATALGFFNEDSTDDETYWNYQPVSRQMAMQSSGGKGSPQ
ncbi:MAG TPA: hypothetical protein VKU01_13190 [Bryobacteraceae bacterium]|nr:hypothetical protein [Bryobacteraceae bacterium]